MAQRILAVEIDAHELKAALIETTFRDYRVVGFYRQPLPSDGASDQVREFLARHQIEPDTVVTSLSGDLVAFRTFFLPFRDRKRLDQTVPFELETQVPFGLDESVVDYHVLKRDGEGTTVLAALVQRRDLEQHLALLSGAGLDPKIVDLAPLAALNVLTLLGEDLPETFVYIDGAAHRTLVALYRNGDLRGLRTLVPLRPAATTESDALAAGNGHQPAADLLSDLVREIRWTVLALNGEPLDPETPCLLGGEILQLEGLDRALAAECGLVTRRLTQSPLRNVPPTLQTEAEQFAAPLGLALREVSPNGALGVNFRQGEFAYHRGQDELRQALWRTAALAAIAVILVLINTYMSYQQLAGRAAALQAQMRNVFSQTLPDVHRIVDERAQLKTEIDTVQKRLQILGGLAPVSGATAIDVMRSIAAAIPDTIKVDTDEYVMDPDAVRLKGSTDSFENVDLIKQQLLNAHYFGDVQVKEVKSASDGKVDFRLILSLSKDAVGSGGATAGTKP